LNFPVFDGLRINADKRAALSQVRSQEYRLHSTELLISSELRLAAQDARSRFAQVEVAERSLRLSQDELRLARQRYEQGVADNREVVEAQNSLAQASDNLVEADYQYNLSRLELARAKGEVRAILSEKAD
jgi:outer membrane protein TolC